MDLPVSPFPDDPRMTPLRDGVAARRLAGAVEASELADPQPYRVRAATVPLRRQRTQPDRMIPNCFMAR